MVQVVQLVGDTYSVKSVDLQNSTLDLIYDMRMCFCYYRELDARTVYTGLAPSVGCDNLKVFVKLVNNEPVDLSLEDWLEQWSRFPEFIPE
jgi:hypothetical protein